MKVTIEALEKYLKHHYKEERHEQSLYMKLAEEMGELAEVLNKKVGRKQTDENDLQAQLGNEIADVIHYAVAMAAINDLDLNEIILSKDKRAAAKYGHEVNLEEFIGKAISEGE